MSNLQKEDESEENIKRQEKKDNSSFGGFAAGRRKLDEKSGSLSFWAFRPNTAAVVLDDALADT